MSRPLVSYLTQTDTILHRDKCVLSDHFGSIATISIMHRDLTASSERPAAAERDVLRGVYLSCIDFMAMTGRTLADMAHDVRLLS